MAGHRYRVAVAAMSGSVTGPWRQVEFFARASAELLNMQQVAQLPSGWHTVPLVDLWTGETFNIRWQRSSTHTDWSPMAPADVRVIQRILNPTGDNRNWNLTSSWSWDPRPGMITVGGRRIAVGFHLFPHGSIMTGANPGSPLRSDSNTSPGQRNPPLATWPVGGHMCMYYSNSTGGGAADWTQRMNNAARAAHGM